MGVTARFEAMAVFRLNDDSFGFPLPEEVTAENDWLLAVGGFYGVAIGSCFFGESMFARVSDASKCAFAHFAGIMFDNGLPWIDCQTYTDHLARFGAKDISRIEYLEMLKVAVGGGD